MGNLLTKCAGQSTHQEAKFVQKIVSWYCPDRYPFPWRNSQDLYFVTICEMLLRRTNVEKVVPVADELLRLFPSPLALANGDRNIIGRILKPLGLNQRVDQVMCVASAFVGLTRNDVERKPEILGQLPGVGPYTAAAVRVLTMERCEPLIDEHVIRILRRVFDLPAKSRRHPSKETREFAARLVPRQTKQYNLGLLDLGRTICKPRNPNCRQCPVCDLCNFALERRNGDGAND